MKRGMSTLVVVLVAAAIVLALALFQFSDFKVLGDAADGALPDLRVCSTTRMTEHEMRSQIQVALQENDVLRANELYSHYSSEDCFGEDQTILGQITESSRIVVAQGINNGRETFTGLFKIIRISVSVGGETGGHIADAAQLPDDSIVSEQDLPVLDQQLTLFLSEQLQLIQQAQILDQDELKDKEESVYLLAGLMQVCKDATFAQKLDADSNFRKKCGEVETHYNAAKTQFIDDTSLQDFDSGITWENFDAFVNFHAKSGASS